MQRQFVRKILTLAGGGLLAISTISLVEAGASAAAPTSWTAQSVTTPIKAMAEGSVNGAPLFASVSTSGATATSSDGITWTAGASIAGFTGSGMTFGNGKFIAVGQSSPTAGAAYSSPDGVTWTAITAPEIALNPLNTIAFGNGVFVTSIAADSGAQYNLTVLTSSDGVNWTALDDSSTPGLPDFDAKTGVAFGNGEFVMIGDGSITTSPDGATWTLQSWPAGDSNGWLESFTSIAVGGGTWVAVSDNSSNDPTWGALNQVMTSTDNGVTWTIQALSDTSLQSASWKSVTYGNGFFVAGGSGGAVMTSPDGVTWTAGASGVSDGTAWAAALYTPSIFVLGGNGGTDATNVITSGSLPAPTTTTTTTTPSGGDVPFTPSDGKLLELAPGKGAMINADRTVTNIEIIATSSTTVKVGDQTIGMELTGNSVSGTTLALQVGGQGSTSGYGFAAGSTVTVFSFSSATKLGTATVKEDGTFVLTFTIPSGLAPGAHTIQAQGTGADGNPRALLAGVTVGGLAATGSSLVIEAVAGLGLVCLGLAGGMRRRGRRLA